MPLGPCSVVLHYPDKEHAFPGCSYQWFHDGALMPGCTASKVVVQPADVDDVGEFECVVSLPDVGVVARFKQVRRRSFRSLVVCYCCCGGDCVGVACVWMYSTVRIRL